ncbi:tRNA (adenosine(37)-N6)-threonylcarbamoyltransferase complex ATPase subunit type 1 TsaE [Rheinheimera sp.]|uniref:tRNA (adenosine(37)-N6)-threonylcarbamoyltransferase complex ATPase subunit type 1 TsaE n=1 Tax=Rheinheimera sp. TaxID=1869214 RepID=UPI00307F5149
MTTSALTLPLDDEMATAALARALAPLLRQGAVLYLKGDLGAGKTTFSRYLLQALGHQGNVKSPTYTLVEPYQLGELTAYHFDLYRLRDPEELEFMGIRDYFSASTLCLIEWPERGYGLLAPADLELQLQLQCGQRTASLTAGNSKAAQWLTQLSGERLA